MARPAAAIAAIRLFKVNERGRRARARARAAAAAEQWVWHSGGVGDDGRGKEGTSRARE